jgi:hypothetical protein
MTAFLAIFFSIYASLHAYVFLRARSALLFGLLPAVTLAVVMGVMIVASVLVRLSETAGFDLCARVLAWIGYTWMGVLFIMICSLTVVDLYRLLLWIVRATVHADPFRPALSGRGYFFLALTLTAAIAVYGYFEALDIRINKVVVSTSKPLPEKNPLRIVLISDVHLGLTVRKERLSRILDKVREARPDILISTGDLVDGPMDRLRELGELLAAMRADYGKFAVTGNHEFYAGLDRALAFTERAGFRVLRGEAVTAAGIVIVGIDDSAGPGYSPVKGIGETELLARQPWDRFILVLKHRPVFLPHDLGLFDLQLSGHVHGGQIFPFRLITRLFFPHYMGLYNLAHGSELFVSRGSGTWGPPIRFLSPPEVTIIEIVHSTSR